MEKEILQEKRTISYVEKAFEEIMQKPFISEVIILNKNGNPIKTTMERNVAIRHAGLYETLRQRAEKIVKQFKTSDEIMMFHIRTKDHEVIICPDGKITVIVIQKPIDGMML
ncbi:dynein light chain roadblock-type 2-like [Teleopsis dalmanni]|uniref:dynein light chain roadblock-type 2-like n=1 Tax=Teleopsis dalmanni TaxID=139649 RepID=UPI0018CF28AD|nr:dynein light chain roadblock-type 2-like [Teleopsis dalmanni]